jgi:hypothetical protein
MFASCHTGPGGLLKGALAIGKARRRSNLSPHEHRKRLVDDSLRYLVHAEMMDGVKAR